MVNWQLTATTIYCDAVNEEVTILVYKDFSTKCTGYNKRAAKAGSHSSKNNKAQAGCQGPACSCVVQYRDKLMAEEGKSQ
jgi:hypothetical protein